MPVYQSSNWWIANGSAQTNPITGFLSLDKRKKSATVYFRFTTADHQGEESF